MLPLKIRNNPFHRIGDSYAHLFDKGHFLGRSAFEDSWMTKPLANISRDDLGYRIKVRVPGFEKEQINVEIDDQVIMVIANKESEESGEVLHEEFLPNHMERRFELSGPLDQERVSATLENGILTINIPFQEQKHVHRVIEVH